MLRKLTPLIAAVVLFTPAVAHADVVQTAPGTWSSVPAEANSSTALDGCHYVNFTYLDAVNQWTVQGYPSCGAGYALSVSATTVVSGTVQSPTQRPDSYVKG